ncbi:MAG: hypothetical protein PHS66_08045 [Candidatus Omnitrophica bacterium]|nr:hypothetical protein [Candidatus Omnitrophota bacterium]
MAKLMKPKLLSPIVFVLLIISTAYCQDAPQPPEISAQEYAVYSDLLADSPDHICVAAEQVGGQGSYLSSHPFTIETVDYFEKSSGVKLDKEMVQSFIALTKSPSLTLENKFHKTIKVVILSEKEQREIFNQEDGWKAFRQKYPDACIVELFRVAFNAEKNMAFTYRGVQCDYLIGNGVYLLLKKENDKWVTVAHVRAWIS